MSIVIRTQLAMVCSLLTAFVITLTGCGGGSSSSAGGGGGASTATVSGRVTNNGFASLEEGNSHGLLATVIGPLISSAHAAAVAGVPVNISCIGAAPVGGITGPDGKFKISGIDIGDSGACAVTVGADPTQIPVQLAAGQETELEVIYSAGVVNQVSTSQSADDSTEFEIEVDDGQNGEDDSSSGDDDSSSGDDDSSGTSSDDD